MLKEKKVNKGDLSREISTDEFLISVALTGVSVHGWRVDRVDGSRVTNVTFEGSFSTADAWQAAQYIANNPPVIRYMHYRIPRYLDGPWGDIMPASGATNPEWTRRYYRGRGKSDWEPRQKGGMTRCMVSLDIFDSRRQRLRRGMFWGVTYCSMGEQFSYAEGRKYALKDVLDRMHEHVQKYPTAFANTIVSDAIRHLRPHANGPMMEEVSRVARPGDWPGPGPYSGSWIEQEGVLVGPEPEAVVDTPSQLRETLRAYSKENEELDLQFAELERVAAEAYAEMLFELKHLSLAEKMDIIASAFPNSAESEKILRAVES